MIKNIKYIVVPLFFICFITSYGQWMPIQTPTLHNLRDISIPSPDLVWVVGDSVILLTTNGGNNWALINHPPIPPTYGRHIFAYDNNTVWWIGGYNSERIFKTTNGGNNWFEQTYSPVNFINGIHFFNASTGIILTDQVSGVYGFFITRNGGASWTRSPNSPTTGNNPLVDGCLGVVDTNLLWFTGFTSNGWRLFKLTGGLYNNWQSYAFLNNVMMRYALFKDVNTALATDGISIQISTNGGANWSIQNDSATGIILYQGSFFLFRIHTGYLLVVIELGSVTISA